MSKKYRITTVLTACNNIKYKHVAHVDGDVIEAIYSGAVLFENYFFKRARKKLRKRMELLGYIEENND